MGLDESFRPCLAEMVSKVLRQNRMADDSCRNQMSDFSCDGLS